jgi:hypothetical protein
MLLAVSRRRQTMVSLVLSIGGVALLVWQVRQAGPAVLVELLGQVGWGFAGILALSLGRLLLRSLAWRTLIARPVPIPGALAATMMGDAIGNVTALSLIASEPAKALYLGRGVPTAHAFAALTAENFFYSVSVAVYIILGTAALLTAFDVPADVRQPAIGALVAMAGILAAAGWLAWRRPSVVSAALSRLPLPRRDLIVDKVREFEVRTYGTATHDTSRLATVIGLHVVFHALSLIESWLTIWLLTGSSSLLAAFVLDTASRVVNVVFRMVPMRVGVDEAVAAAVALPLGLPAAIGTATALVRKGRVAVWAVVGFALILWQRPHQ